MVTSDLRSQASNPLAVRIARGNPRWAFAGRAYLDLAPTFAMLKLGPVEYDRAFAAILAQRDPVKVYADLGPDAVLCCFERPFVRCHRRYVAEWLEAALGVEIPELGYDRASTPAYAAMTSGK